jgi:hypothetical protein
MKYLIMLFLLTSSCATVESGSGKKKLICHHVGIPRDAYCFEVDEE